MKDVKGKRKRRKKGWERRGRLVRGRDYKKKKKKKGDKVRKT
jgi:hypothetical protein